MDILKIVEDSIFEKINQFEKKPKFILGLSGGVDSVFLFHVLKKMHMNKIIDLTCAHFNHGWRIGAYRDRDFCQKIVKVVKPDIQFIQGYAKDYVKRVKIKGSLEEVGRHMRQEFFADCQQEYNADLVILGHHQDDQLETFFIRLARGAGVDGLSCMKDQNGYIFRPMLNVAKREIINFVEREQLKFIEDPTNSDIKFLRNRIRHKLVPNLGEIDLRLEAKIIDSIQQLSYDTKLLQDYTNLVYSAVFKKQAGGSLCGYLKEFEKHHPHLQRKLLIKLLCDSKCKFNPSYAFFNEMLKFLNSPNGGKHQLNESWAIVKKASYFWVEK